MGYFSNGTEGEMYQEQYCVRCLHYGPVDGPGCPVFGIHLAYNYDQHDDKKLKAVLDSLIPRRPDSFNDQCRMFFPNPAFVEPLPTDVAALDAACKGIAYEMFAKAHPVECHANDPGKFWQLFHSKRPDVSREEMERLLKETAERDEDNR